MKTQSTDRPIEFVSYVHPNTYMDETHMKKMIMSEVMKLSNAEAKLQLKKMTLLMDLLCKNVFPDVLKLPRAKFAYECSAYKMCNGNISVRYAFGCKGHTDVVSDGFNYTFASSKFKTTYQAKLTVMYMMFYSIFADSLFTMNFADEDSVQNPVLASGVFESYVDDVSIKCPKYDSIEEAVMNLGLLGYDLSDVLKR